MSERLQRCVPTEDGALHVTSRGTGTPVVLLHGFTGSGESMEGVAAGLADDHAVHSPDLLGFGRSDAPDVPAAYTMSRCLTQLCALQDALRLGPAHWIGYSMGGRVALSLAAAQPERLRSLVLVGASPGLADAAAREARVRHDESLARRLLEQGLEAFVDGWMAQPLFASQQRLGEAALARARAQRLRNRPEVLAASLRGMGTGVMPPLHDALPRIRVPVLLVVGEEDEKFRAIAADMARALPDARLAVIAEAGHAAHLEQPAAFAAQVRSFLSAQETDRRGLAAEGR